jgi:hypothetical protein
LLGLWVLVLGATWPISAHAEEKVRLVYVRGAGAEDCPAEVDLRLWVIARLGYDPFSPQASRVVISRVEARADALVSNLEVIDQGGMSTGQRELTAKPGRCGELARALALSISLAIDPDGSRQAPTERGAKASEEAATPPEEASTSVEAAPPAPAASAPVGPPAEPSADPPHAFAGLSLTSSLGILPGLSLGAKASFGWRLRWVSVSLDALGQRSFSRDLEPSGQLGGTLLGGGASLCAISTAWEACAVGRAAAQRLAAAGVAHPAASNGLFLGVGPRLAGVVPLGRRLAFVAGLEGLLHLPRNSAQLSGKEVWRTPQLSGTLELGVRALFL